ncbi:MAG: DNA polymerase IV [Planctomycetota bacterium]
MERAILHADMDAFFAAIEQRDRPELRGKPVIVGGTPEGRGVVSTASYEARVYGVHSAMPAVTAVRLCPQAVFLRPDFRRYQTASRQVFEIFQKFTPLVEGLSLDEAFLDVTGSRRLFGDAVTIAQRIRAEVRETTRLTVSVGVAPNKLLAKIASDLEKPDGLTVVTTDNVSEVLRDLPTGRIPGLGPKVAEQLARSGIRTIGQLAALPVSSLNAWFGDFGESLHRMARGIDERPVVAERQRKSLSAETTFARDVRDRDELERRLLGFSHELAFQLRAEHLMARTVSIKVRDPSFRTRTRSHTLELPTDIARVIFDAARELLDSCPWRSGVRLIGIGLTQFKPSDAGRQLSLLDDDLKDRDAAKALDQIRERFGSTAVRPARLVDPEEE